jgi:tetratricopeptide (TPR) repeat protein
LVENLAESWGVPPRRPQPAALAEAWRVWAKSRPLLRRIVEWQADELFAPAARPGQADVTVSGAAVRSLFSDRVPGPRRGGVKADEAMYRLHRGRIDYALALLADRIALVRDLDVTNAERAAEARAVLRRASLVLVRAAAEGKLTAEEQKLYAALGAAQRRLPAGPPATAAEARARKALSEGDYCSAGRELALELLDETAGDRKPAIPLLRWLLAVRPSDVAVRRRLVSELYAAWRWKEAAREQERVVRDLGKEAQAGDYELLANLQLGLGDPERAAETFAAAKLDATSPAARVFALRVATQQRRFGEAHDLGSRLATDPKASTPQKQLAELTLAAVAWETGAADEAEARVKRGLDAAPQDGFWRFSRGYLLAAQGHLCDEAEEGIWNALGAGDPHVLGVWGWYLALRRPQDPEGFQTMEGLASHELMAADPVFFDQLGDAYRAAGRADKAREAWQTALALFPKAAAPDDHRKRTIEMKIKDIPGG